MCRHKMCSFGLVCMFHKIWDITKYLRYPGITSRQEPAADHPPFPGKTAVLHRSVQEK